MHFSNTLNFEPHRFQGNYGLQGTELKSSYYYHIYFFQIPHIFPEPVLIRHGMRESQYGEFPGKSQFPAS